MTSAGRLRKKMSQLSKKRSAPLWRPRKRPSADPISIASAKLTTTRASVAPTWVSSEPERISRSRASSTCRGLGKRRLEREQRGHLPDRRQGEQRGERPCRAAKPRGCRRDRPLSPYRRGAGRNGYHCPSAPCRQARSRGSPAARLNGSRPLPSRAECRSGSRPDRRELGMVGRFDEIAQPLPRRIVGGEDLVARLHGSKEIRERLLLLRLGLLAPHEADEGRHGRCRAP